MVGIPISVTEKEILEHYKRCKHVILKWAKEGDTFRAFVQGHNGWWDKNREKGTAKLYYPDETTYDRIIKGLKGERRSLYWTAQLFYHETSNIEKTFDFEKGRITEQIGGREDTVYHSFFLDLDRAKDKDIEDPDVQKWLEKALKFFANKFLKAGITSFGLAFSGGGCYVYLHPQLGRMPLIEGEKAEDHAYKIEVIQRAFDLFIGDTADEFFKKHPEALSFVKFDRLNYDKKRQVKTILSVHKKHDFAVIPLDQKTPKINLEKASLPIDDDIIENAETWLRYTEDDFDKFGELLEPWLKKAQETLVQKHGTRTVNVAEEEVNIKRWAPCMKNLIKRKELKSGGGATRALAVLASYMRFMGVPEAKAYKIFHKKAGEWNAETSNIFESWYGCEHLTKPQCFVPSCEKMRTKGSGYPHPELGELEICTPDERCKNINSPIQYHNRDEFKLQPADFYLTVIDEKKDIKKILVKLFADDLIKIHRFKTLADTEEMLYYKDGCYHYNAESVIRGETERVFGKYANIHNVKEIISHVQRTTYIKREKLNNSPGLLNLQNGLFDVNTMSFNPHSPDVVSTIQMPINYDSQADCTAIKKFFSEIVYEKDIPLLEEMIGYCLYHKYPFQNWFLLHGGGSNGKSQVLALIREFLGIRNVASVPLQALNQRFAPIRVYGKSANIVADLSDKDLIRTDTLKALTGGDLVTAEQKFRNPFEFINHAKLIYSCNRVPLSDDKSKAFYRRVIYIPFPNTFEGETADVNILEKLTTESELSGLFNLSIVALKRILDQKRFSYDGSAEENEELYERASNPVYGFISDCCELNYEDYTSKPELYDSYCEYCRDTRVVAASEKKFVQQLKLLVAVVEERMSSGGRRVRVWKGIKVKEKIEDSLEQSIYYWLSEFSGEDDRGALDEALITRVADETGVDKDAVREKVDVMIEEGSIGIEHHEHGNFLLIC